MSASDEKPRGEPGEVSGAEQAAGERSPSGDGPAAEPGPETGAREVELTPAERELAVYPLREAAEDPRWAVRIVWTWVGIALASTAFTIALVLLGYFYD